MIRHVLVFIAVPESPILFSCILLWTKLPSHRVVAYNYHYCLCLFLSLSWFFILCFHMLNDTSPIVVVAYGIMPLKDHPAYYTFMLIFACPQPRNQDWIHTRTKGRARGAPLQLFQQFYSRQIKPKKPLEDPRPGPHAFTAYITLFKFPQGLIWSMMTQILGIFEVLSQVLSRFTRRCHYWTDVIWFWKGRDVMRW